MTESPQHDGQGVKNTPEQVSKDAFFARIAQLSEEMIDAHGKDFAVGALVLAARFIADGRMTPPGGAPRKN